MTNYLNIYTLCLNENVHICGIIESKINLFQYCNIWCDGMLTKFDTRKL